MAAIANAKTLRALVLALVALVAVWQTVDGVAQRVATHRADARSVGWGFRLGAGFERRIARSLGDRYELWRALDAHLPERSYTYCEPRDADELRLLSSLRHALYPRLLLLEPPPEPPPGPDRLGDGISVFRLHLDAGAPPPPPHWRAALRRPDFALYRLGGGE